MRLAIYLPREALKSGPVANRAGLHFDETRRRWVKNIAISSSAQIPNEPESVDTIHAGEITAADVPKAFDALKHGGSLHATIRNRPPGFDESVTRSGGRVDGNQVHAVKHEPAVPADHHFASAFASLHHPLARWVHLEEDKPHIAQTFNSLTRRERDALHHANKEAFQKEHGGEYATLYREMRPGDNPAAMGLASVSAHRYNQGKNVHAFRVHHSDVLMHYAARDRSGTTSPLAAIAHEQEVVLKPGAHVEHLGPADALKSGPIANAAGLHLDPSTHRWTRDSPDAPLFHTTTHAAMDHISSNGLQPRQGAGVFGHGGYAEHSQGKVFLSAHDDAARHWHQKVAEQVEDAHGDNEGDDPDEGNYVGHRIPVMLRVAHRKTQVDPIGDKDIPGSRMVKKAIPASEIEYWHPGKKRWRPASTWGDDTGTRHATEGDDHGRSVNADAFAAPRSAAYRDDQPAEARDHAEAEAKRKTVMAEAEAKRKAATQPSGPTTSADWRARLGLVK